MDGIKKETLAVFNVLSNYDEIKPYFLIGGTAVALSINHRLSEDLDFFTYNLYPGKQFQLPNIAVIFEKIKTDFTTIDMIHFSKFEASLLINNVKVDFFSDKYFHQPKQFYHLNKVKIPSINDLLGMKLVTLCLRDEWRDVYDIFSIAKHINADLDLFKNSYDTIMSSYFAGSKSKKENIFFAIMNKLSKEAFINKIYKIEKKLDELQFNKSITPEIMAEFFISLKNQKFSDLSQK
jgi:hypothetical protein